MGGGLSETPPTPPTTPSLWVFSALPFKKKKCIYLFVAVLGLRCCEGFSLVVASGDYSLVVKASHFSGFSCRKAWALGY